MDPRIERWRHPPDHWESVREDVAPYRDATLADRFADLLGLCDMAMQFIDLLPPAQRERALQDEEPLAPEREQGWRRLVAQGRAQRH